MASSLLTGLSLLSLASATCYYPNGTAAPTEKKICDATSAFSSCCSPSDICADGLCRNTYDAANNNWVWREQCTDPTWQSDACPKYCYDERTAAYASSQVWQVLDCGSGNFCCTYARTDGLTTPNVTSCCSDSERVFVIGSTSTTTTSSTATSSQSSTTSSAEISTTATATTSTTSTSIGLDSESATSSPSPAVKTPQHTNLSTGTSAGVGVGAALGAIAIVSLMFWLWRRNSKRRHPDSDDHVRMVDPRQFSQASERKIELGVEGERVELGHHGHQKVELGQEGLRSEMPAFDTGPPAELPDSSRRPWGR